MNKQLLNKLQCIQTRFELNIPEYNLYEKDFYEIKKSIIAFEIIKEKRVDVDTLIWCYQMKQPTRTYNLNSKGEKLFKEEFDLLKEVLEK